MFEPARFDSSSRHALSLKNHGRLSKLLQDSFFADPGQDAVAKWGS